METLGTNVVARAASHLRFWSRKSTTLEKEVSHFGRSFTRAALHRAGYFPTGLDVGEDTYHNQKLDAFSKPFYARDIVTLHRDPSSVLGYILDEFRRGGRRAMHAPYRGLIASQTIYQKVCDFQSKRWAKAWANFEPMNDCDTPALQAMKKTQKYGLWAERAGILLAMVKLRVSFRLANLAQRIERQSKGGALFLAQQAVKLDPQNVMRHYKLGILQANSPNAKQQENALLNFQSALSLSPHYFEALGAAASSLENAGQANAALTLIETAVVTSAATLGYVDMACEMAFRAKQYDVALAYGRKALARSPDNPLFHRRLANIHIIEGREKLARLRLKMANELENLEQK